MTDGVEGHVMMSIPVCEGERANASFLVEEAAQIQGSRMTWVVAEAIDEGGSVVEEDASTRGLQLNMPLRASD